MTIRTETRYLFDVIRSICYWPIIVMGVLRGKRSARDAWMPLIDVLGFIKEPMVTFWLCVTIILSSCIGWVVSADLFSLLVIYPSDIVTPSRWYSILTSSLIHADLGHLVSNIVILYLLGRVLERQLGGRGVFITYVCALLISSVGSGFIHLFIGEIRPSLGASGAIMGVVAGAMLLAPLQITYLILLPLPVMVIGWFALITDMSGLFYPADPTIGHLAHLAGFLGISIGVFLVQRTRPKAFRGLLINIISVLGLLIYVAL